MSVMAVSTMPVVPRKVSIATNVAIPRLRFATDNSHSPKNSPDLHRNDSNDSTTNGVVPAPPSVTTAAATEVKTPSLHDAVLWGHFHNLKCLLQSGEDANQRDPSDGSTPLHKAAKIGLPSFGCLKVLLNFGADPTLKNSNGELPSGVALDSTIARFLLHKEEEHEKRKEGRLRLYDPSLACARWRSVWCVLRGGFLYCYGNRAGGNRAMEVIIPLVASDVNTAEHTTKRQFTFLLKVPEIVQAGRLVEREDLSYFFQARSELEMSSWISTLRKSTEVVTSQLESKLPAEKEEALADISVVFLNITRHLDEGEDEDSEEEKSDPSIVLRTVDSEEAPQLTGSNSKDSDEEEAIVLPSIAPRERSISSLRLRSILQAPPPSSVSAPSNLAEKMVVPRTPTSPMRTYSERSVKEAVNHEKSNQNLEKKAELISILDSIDKQESRSTKLKRKLSVRRSSSSKLKDAAVKHPSRQSSSGIRERAQTSQAISSPPMIEPLPVRKLSAPTEPFLSSTSALRPSPSHSTPRGMEGFLWINSHKRFGTWRLRWAVLKDTQVLLFKEQIDGVADPKKSSGKINLRKAKRVEAVADIAKRQNCFALTTSSRTTTLQALSVDDRSEWIRVLHETIVRLRHTPSPNSSKPTSPSLSPVGSPRTNAGMFNSSSNLLGNGLFRLPSRFHSRSNSVVESDSVMTSSSIQSYCSDGDSSSDHFRIPGDTNEDLSETISFNPTMGTSPSTASCSSSAGYPQHRSSSISLGFTPRLPGRSSMSSCSTPMTTCRPFGTPDRSDRFVPEGVAPGLEEYDEDEDDVDFCANVFAEDYPRYFWNTKPCNVSPISSLVTRVLSSPSNRLA